MTEKTFVFIKPWSIEQADEIFNFLDTKLGNNFEKTQPVLIKNIPKETIQEHYEHISHLKKFDNLLNDFINGSISVAIYTGEDMIQRIREVIGPTDPSQAHPETIRGKFSNDSIEQCDKENRPLKNVIHSSDSIEGAEREIQLWSSFLNF